MTSYRNVADQNHVGFFQMVSNGFQDFEIIVFEKKNKSNN